MRICDVEDIERNADKNEMWQLIRKKNRLYKIKNNVKMNNI